VLWCIETYPALISSNHVSLTPSACSSLQIASRHLSIAAWAEPWFHPLHSQFSQSPKNLGRGGGSAVWGRQHMAHTSCDHSQHTLQQMYYNVLPSRLELTKLSWSHHCSAPVHCNHYLSQWPTHVAIGSSPGMSSPPPLPLHYTQPQAALAAYTHDSITALVTGAPTCAPGA
jgi:hypothetical protein